MPRDLPLGNGCLFVAFDKDYQLRELTYPHVGEENHAGGERFRFGVFADGAFSWVPEGWAITRDYLDDALVTNVVLVSEALGLRIVANDAVDYEENLYLKKLTVENLGDAAREVRVFLAHAFSILGNSIGDTAAYRPEARALVHYKGERYFLVNAFANKKAGIDEFATGNRNRPDLEGTWRDAEDGALSGNPIAQGTVDSVLAVPLRLEPRGRDTCYVWVAAGRTWEEVRALDAQVVRRGPESYLRRTLGYWKLWSGTGRLEPGRLPPEIDRLYARSLLIARTLVDDGGAIVAANDSDSIQFNRDTYSYLWPRDGALVAHAFDLAGHGEIARSFFAFCARIIEKDGYFLHKYTPSGKPASSWHPWLKDGRPQLPIQEDETALVLWALWRHFELSRDVEFVKPLYKPLVVAAADFMMNYRDRKTRLPQMSYDLWEERQGVLTFTAAAVHGGLVAAASFAEAFGELERAADYRRGAAQMREAMDRHLFLEREGRFARMVRFERDGTASVDATVDASLFGIFAFGAYPPEDPRVAGTMRQVEEALRCRTAAGGLARYEGDPYYRIVDGAAGNPWFIATLWLASWRIAVAKQPSDLAAAMELLRWVADHALPSGVLAEQVNPATNEPLSVSPLAWSHGTFITTVAAYLRRLDELSRGGA
jgi:GH15 family glucan-1,4-alpha-glucosidase